MLQETLISPVQNAELVRDWAGKINGAIRQDLRRPQSLLVLLNPFGGARKARGIWRDIALPVFDLAGTVINSCGAQ